MSLLYFKVFGKLETLKFYIQIYKIIDTKLESFNIFTDLLYILFNVH